MASALLFAMAFIFAVIAFIGGINFEDRYPGYGPLDRERRRIAEQSAATIDAERRKLAIAKDAKLRDVGSERDFAQGLLAQYAEKARRAQQMRARLAAYLHSLEAVANHQAGLYRQANRSARHTPTPAYFNAPLSLAGAVHSTLDSTDELDAPSQAALNGCLDRVIAAYDELQGKFPTLEEL